MLIRILIVIGYFALIGCIHVPKELRLISVEEITSSTQNYEPPSFAESMLRVEFSSIYNVIEYTGNHENAFSLDAFFCDNPSEVAFLSDSPFFFKRLDKINENSLYIYEAYFFVKWNQTKPLPIGKRLNGQKHYIKYDLLTNPKDICFYVSGTDFIGMGQISNYLRLRKPYIIEALNRNKKISNEIHNN